MVTLTRESLLFYGIALGLLGMVFSILYRLLGKLNGPSIGARLIVAFSSVFMALGLYSFWGTDKLADYYAIERINQVIAAIQKDKDTPESVMSRFSDLEHKIEDSHYALAHLGALYQEINLYDRAETQFHKAFLLSPSNTEYGTQWIYSHSRTSKGRLTDSVREQAHAILAISGNKKSLLNVLAIHYYQEKDYSEAISLWESLLTQESPDSAGSQGVRRAIEVAKEKQQQVRTQEQRAASTHIDSNS